MGKGIRNIGIVAHIDAGKTTTMERILFYTQKTHKIGEVDSGTATMDWMSQEQNRGITIVSAATTCYWKEIQLNIIDTPGHVDFTAEVERSLRVLDGTVGIFCAVGGVEPQSETVWRQADNYGVPRLAYINKMDRVGANFYRVLEEIEHKLKIKPLPVSIPIGAEGNYSGNIDLLEMREIYWDTDSSGIEIEYRDIAEERRGEAERWRDKLLDYLSDYNEEITESYLENGTVSSSLIKKTLRELTIENKIFPVLPGSSLKNKGVQPLLDAICDYLPSPEELDTITVASPDGKKEYHLNRDSNDKLSALVFKLQHDREMGILSFVRVYSGSLKANMNILNSNLKIKERVNRILRMHANHHEKISEIAAGDIGVAVGLKTPRTGDTLTLPAHPLLLEKMNFPEPVISVAIETGTVKDQDKLNDALEKLGREDPTFTVKKNEETGQLIISGMGELHIDVLVKRITDDFNIAANIGKPQVNYRETVSKELIYTETYNRTLAGKEHYASVTLEVTPRKRGEGNLFKNDVKNFPDIYLESVKRGIEASFSSGISLGYPCVDIGIRLLAVDFQVNKASEIAFETATSLGFDYICRQAEPILLEPVMKVNISCPSEQIGDVISSLVKRGGHISSTESRMEIENINAEIFLSQMFGYSTSLRSLTKGRGIFSMEFSHFSKSNIL